MAKFQFLFTVESDDPNAKCNQFSWSCTRKGKHIPLKLVEVIDDDQHENPPYIGH